MTESETHSSDASVEPHAKRHWIASVLVVLAALVVIGLLVRWFVQPTVKPVVAPKVSVATDFVKIGDINVFLDELGTVTPVYTVTVASRVAGQLAEVHYSEGQIVRKGELLALIDPRPYQAAVVQAQGQLGRDTALLKNARLDLVRYQNSYQEHAIPEQQLATQQALVEQDEGLVKLDQGNLDAAQVNLDYTRIAAPINGRVGLRAVDPGNIVPANGTTGIATITQLQPITVIFTIAEDDLGAVVEQTAMGHKLAVDALDRTQQRKLASGSLLTLDNQINVATGTVRARATFPNTHNELFPNQFVNARLLVRTLASAKTIPDAAIQHNGDAAFVYVVQPDNTVQSRPVKVLASDAGMSAVTGVEANEQLVVDGFDKLQAGTSIEIRKSPAKASAAGATPASGAVKNTG
jgi:multidrug efflux system membrane fusion protein